MARLKQQQQLETVEAQAGQEAILLPTVAASFLQAVSWRKQSELWTQIQMVDVDGCHWMLFLNDSSTPGWRKQRVPLQLLPSSRSMVHWSESSMSASHL